MAIQNCVEKALFAQQDLLLEYPGLNLVEAGVLNCLQAIEKIDDSFFFKNPNLLDRKLELEEKIKTYKA